MTDKLWKRIERQLAELFGGERVPITGRQRGDVPDIRHHLFSFEVKHRANLPGWLHDAMAQAILSMDEHHKIPVVVLHEKYQKIEDSYVIIKAKHLKRFLNLYEEVSQ